VKLFTLASLVFLSVVAIAKPEVGDVAVYVTKYRNQQNQLKSTTIELSLVGKTEEGLLMLKQKRLVSETQEVLDEKIENLEISQIPSIESEEDLKQFCDRKKGIMEPVQIDANTIIPTCMSTYIAVNSERKIWLGMVPFTMVKQVTTQNGVEVLSLVLRSFSKK
jgi:hypothetical protein